MVHADSSGALAALPAVVGWGPAVVALLLTLVLAWLLPAPGYTTTRLAFFVLLAAVAWGGAAGALAGRASVVGASALVLFLLGFWQAVLWVVVLPAALLDFVAAVAIRDPRSGRPDPSG